MICFCFIDKVKNIQGDLRLNGLFDLWGNIYHVLEDDDALSLQHFLLTLNPSSGTLAIKSNN